MNRCTLTIALALVFALVSTSLAATTTRPTTRPAAQLDEAFFDPVVAALGKGVFKEQVLVISRPRTDLEVGHIDLGDIPVAAGLSSEFYFFKCPCGKMDVVGQFCVADYEVNTVIDELRNAGIQLVSISPMFLGERPKILSIRFQGRGNAEVIAKGIKDALQWVGEQSGTKK